MDPLQLGVPRNRQVAATLPLQSTDVAMKNFLYIRNHTHCPHCPVTGSTIAEAHDGEPLGMTEQQLSTTCANMDIISPLDPRIQGVEIAERLMHAKHGSLTPATISIADQTEPFSLNGRLGHYLYAPSRQQRNRNEETDSDWPQI